MSFTQVNLAGLPEPDVIERLDYEQIVLQLKDAVAAAHPPLAAVLQIEGEPATKVIEVCAAFVLLTRARINDAARGVMLAFATGTSLDHLAALLGVERLELIPATDDQPAAFETDEDLRARTQLAVEGLSTAGPRGAYLFHALSAHPDVLDVSISGPHDHPSVEPGSVVVAVVSRSESGVPESEILDSVAAALNADTVRPLTDTVIVRAATPLPFSVRAVLHIAPEAPSGLIIAEAKAELEAYIAQARRAGSVLAVSGIYGALQRTGVISVNLQSPLADVAANPFQFPAMTSVELTAVVG